MFFFGVFNSPCLTARMTLHEYPVVSFVLFQNSIYFEPWSSSLFFLLKIVVISLQIMRHSPEVASFPPGLLFGLERNGMIPYPAHVNRAQINPFLLQKMIFIDPCLVGVDNFSVWLLILSYFANSSDKFGSFCK